MPHPSLSPSQASYPVVVVGEPSQLESHLPALMTRGDLGKAPAPTMQPVGGGQGAWAHHFPDPAAAQAAIHAWTPIAQEAQLDLALLAPAERLSDRSVLAMDMDSTVINIECIDELADCAGKKAEVSEITEATMRGEIKDFPESLRRRVALLAGLREGAIAEVIRDRLRFNPGAVELLRAARSSGLRTVLVSGGFTVFAKHVAEALGFDEFHANTLEVIDGRLTGRVLGPIVDGEFKKATLLRVCAERGVPASRSIAVGDGSNDLPMMAAAGLSVAYHAKPKVRAQAQRAINFGRLDSPLLLGMSEPAAR